MPTPAQVERERAEARQTRTRMQHEQLMDWYRAYRAGEETTAAEKNLATTAKSAENLARAQAASARGVSGMQAVRAGGQAAGDLQNEALQQRTLLRSQERMAIDDMMARYMAERQRLSDYESNARASMNDQARVAYAETQAQADSAIWGIVSNMVGTVANMFGSMSDRRAKEDIRPARDEDVTDFMRALVGRNGGSNG